MLGKKEEESVLTYEQIMLQGESSSIQKECLLEEAADLWLQKRKEDIRESTYAMYYQKIHRYIIPNLGRIQLQELTEVQLNGFLKRLIDEGGLSWKTVSDIRSVLKMILDWAASNGCPEIRNMRLYMPSPLPQPMEILTIKEQRKLEGYLLKEMSEVHLGLLLSLYGGLRIGEVCGLKWGDIDFRKGTMTIRRTVMRIQETDEESDHRTKVMITQPKTYNSNRTIPVVKEVLEYLKVFRKGSETFILTGTLICMEPRTLTVHYKRILKAAGISSYKYHALRHTFATRCVEQGIDVKTLGEIMGHSSVKITMDRYVHPSMDFKKKQISRLKLNPPAKKTKKPMK